jgi:hypothetical protein
MPVTKRRKVRGKGPRTTPSLALKKGLSLKGLLRSTPSYFKNSAEDIAIRKYKSGLTTKTGLPAIQAYGVADYTATNEPPTPHKMLIVGLQKGKLISEQSKVLVTCDCENYAFVWEYANTVNGSSRIRHSNGEPPIVTNPTFRPGLCKHLCALTQIIISKGD